MHFSKITQAFSLIEMFMVLAIGAIILAISVPSLTPFLGRAEDQTLLAQLTRALQLARQEAILRHAMVTICKSQDQTHCNGDWQNGFIVFIDQNADEVMHDKSQLIYVFQRSSTKGVLHWRAFPPAKNYLQFLADGTTNHINATFWYCRNQQSSPAWAVAVSQSGRSRVVHPDRQGEVDDEKGVLLQCT